MKKDTKFLGDHQKRASNQKIVMINKRNSVDGLGLITENDDFDVDC